MPVRAKDESSRTTSETQAVIWFGHSLQQNDQAHNKEEDDYEHSQEQRREDSVHIKRIGAVCILLCLHKEKLVSRGRPQ